MSPSDREALKAIADELRTLPGRGDSPGERLQSAGRLLIVAIESGAFAEPRFVGFRALVRQRSEQPKVDGFVSAWSEAVWWLKGRPTEPLDHVGDLANDVGLVIDRMRESLMSQERAGSGQGSPTTDLAERLATLRPSHRKAYCQRLHAQRHGPALEPEQSGDTPAHKWLTLHGDEDGEQPAALKTWTRYLREVRRVL